MALFGLFGKKRETESFFVNAYGNNQTRGIYTFDVDVDNGELLFKHHFSTPSNPSFSYIFGRFVCITYKNRTGSVDDGGICCYSMTADTLMLTSRLTDGGKTYTSVCTNGTDQTANRIYATDYYNGEILVGAILKRKLQVPLSVYKLTGKSVHPIKQTQAHPCFCDFLPDDDNKLLVCDLGQDKIFIFDIEKKELIMNNDLSFDVKPGSGPLKAMFNIKGDIMYLLNSLSSDIEVYKYSEGKFELIQTVDTYPKNEEEVENEATQMKPTLDEKHLYVTNSGHDSLALFDINEDGTLKYVEFADTSAKPSDLELFRDKWIVVTCKKGSIIESYEYVEDRGGMIFETKFSYLVNEPISITKFINQIG